MLWAKSSTKIFWLYIILYLAMSIGGLHELKSLGCQRVSVPNLHLIFFLDILLQGREIILLEWLPIQFV